MVVSYLKYHSVFVIRLITNLCHQLYSIVTSYSPCAPVLAVRLHELFGLPETLAINEGRNRVMIHLLSPAYRPVQVTQDLRSFWENTYQEVRKELRIRYPKHHWPEDPWTAEAVRGAKRKTK